MATGPRRVVLIGFVDSIHFARWVEVAQDATVNMLILNSAATSRIHPKLKRLLDENPNIKIIGSHSERFTNLRWQLDKLVSNWVRGTSWGARILLLKPDLVHVLETQNGGYPLSRAYSLIPSSRRPPMILTSYGSDFFWFGKSPTHRKKISSLLQKVAVLSSECSRDFELARAWGYLGEFSTLTAITGGIRASEIAPLNDSVTRNRIIIKGNLGVWGRADLALNLVARLGNIANALTVTVYSASPEMEELSRDFARKNGWTLDLYKEGELEHTELLGLFRQALAYVGMSRSDGASTSCLEAMSQGAFPIQSDTSCSDEWFQHGLSGFSLGELSSEADIREILQILSDPKRLARARAINRDVILLRYNQESVKVQAENLYRPFLKVSSTAS